MRTRAVKPGISNGRIAPLSMVDYYAELSSFMRCGLPGKAPHITLTKREVGAGAEFLKGRGIDPQRPLLGIVPGAGYGGAKMWPSPYFAEAGDALAKALGAKPIIFAEAKDTAAAGEIAGSMSHEALDMSGEQSSIALLKQLMARCSLVLTTDSGPRHIAAALGVPVVVVIGSADPIYSTTSHEHVAVERIPVDCSPCMLRECPTDHRCMNRLKPDQVIRSALNLLQKVKTG